MSFYIVHGTIFTLLYQGCYQMDESIHLDHSVWQEKIPVCDVVQRWTPRPRPSFSASLCLHEWESPLRELATFQHSAPPTFPLIGANGEKHVKLPWQLAGRHRVVCVCCVCICDRLKESLQRETGFRRMGEWESLAPGQGEHYVDPTANPFDAKMTNKKINLWFWVWYSNITQICIIVKCTPSCVYFYATYCNSTFFLLWLELQLESSYWV